VFALDVGEVGEVVVAQHLAGRGAGLDRRDVAVAVLAVFPDVDGSSEASFGGGGFARR
jgi:hypothetical protein